MRLEDLGRSLVAPAENGSGQQHSQRLSADQPGADHAPPDLHDVLEGEVALCELEHPFVARYHHAQQPIQQGLSRFRSSAAASDRLEQSLRLNERALPGAGADLGIEPPAPFPGGQDRGNDGARGDRLELVALPDMEHLHGRRIAMLDLERADVERLVMTVHVQQELRRLRDCARRVGRVAVPQQSEVGDGFEIVEVRAREHEEVAEHLVGVPVGRKVGKTVEEVEGSPSGLFDHAVYVCDEALEAGLRMKLVNLRSEIGREKRLVFCEPEVDQSSLRALRRLAVRRGKGQVVLDRVHLPDDVVAGQNAFQHSVQPVHPRCETRIR